MGKTRAVNVFYGHAIASVLFLTFGMWSATQYVAYALAYQAQLGPPIATVFDHPVYWPWQWVSWSYHFQPYAPNIFVRATWIIFGAFFSMVTVIFLMSVKRFRKKSVGTHGSARWATELELKRAALCKDAGVVLAQTADAQYQCYVKESLEDFELGWKMTRPGRQLIRHSGPEHVMCFAPTRSGKGVGLVIPTLLTWTRSALVYDIKSELWEATSGWRQQFSHVWKFDPTSPTCAVRFNPLMVIRKGAFEVRDVQNVADILVDPDGSKERLDHWEKTGHALLVGVILHVLYSEADKTLSGVNNFIANPKRTIFETLDLMLNTHHMEDGPHPTVASCAREMMNKSENELSGVVSTAMSFLGLYRDPIIAKNTACSDFEIDDLMNADAPVSLYLVVPPSDIDRAKPLIRLMLNQIGRRLTEKMHFKEKHYKHRLLMMLDEFPSLGRLGFFETELAYLAGYGIKCFMVAQSLNQIEKAYGANNSILDNSHVRVTYGALDDRTAKRISDLLGQATETRRLVNFAGSRIAPWLGHVMESEQESPRALLTPGEILQLPADTALVMVGGMPPYRAKKVMYYQDNRFKGRAWLPPPDETAQKRELILQREENEWLKIEPRAEPKEPTPPENNEHLQGKKEPNAGASDLDDQDYEDYPSDCLADCTDSAQDPDKHIEGELVGVTNKPSGASVADAKYIEASENQERKEKDLSDLPIF